MLFTVMLINADCRPRMLSLHFIFNFFIRIIVRYQRKENQSPFQKYPSANNNLRSKRWHCSNSPVKTQINQLKITANNMNLGVV